MSEWYADDSFWLDFAPFMFHERRLEGTPAEVDQVEALTGLQPGAAVLDLGCGMGRHSLELARRGYRVTGVDLSAVYLQQAREAARQEGLDVAFLHEDMRRFRRPGVFDLAINLYTTFGYFAEAADNLRVLENICASLRPDGLLVMELSSKEILARTFQERDWREQGEAIMVEERRVIDDWRRVWNRWILFTGGERREYEFTHWVYSAVELEMMLMEAGFAQAEFYRGLAGGPFDHDVQRLALVARKH